LTSAPGREQQKRPRILTASQGAREGESNINFDPLAPSFTVHPGLKETLELIEAGDAGEARS